MHVWVRPFRVIILDLASAAEITKSFTFILRRIQKGGGLEYYFFPFFNTNQNVTGVVSYAKKKKKMKCKITLNVAFKMKCILSMGTLKQDIC